MKTIQNLKFKVQHIDDKTFKSWVKLMPYTSYREIIAEARGRKEPIGRTTLTLLFTEQKCSPRTQRIVAGHFNRLKIRYNL